MLTRACLVASLCACGDDGTSNPLPDAPCFADDVTVVFEGPAAFACHDPYKATIKLTNNTCGPLDVTGLVLTGSVTAGQCGAPGPGNYVADPMTVPRGSTTLVLDLTTGPFCCGSPGCPTPFTCDEHYTMEVTTTAGTFTGTKDVTLDLGGCDVICP